MDDTCFEDDETIREFLVESRENLDRLDQEMVELEKKPQDAQLLGAIFRTMHTLKGAAGFLAFTKLERVTHQAENLLSLLRDGKLLLASSHVTAILEAVDAVRSILDAVEVDGKEGNIDIESLVKKLREASAQDAPKTETAPATPVAEPITVAVAQPAVAAPVFQDAVAVAPAAATAKAVEGEVEKPTPVAVEKPAVAVAPQAEAPSEEEEKARPSASDANIRVAVGLLDKLMDLVGELVLARNQILQFNAEREDPVLNSTSQRLNLITSELQEGVMKTRMQPIGVVWNNLPRVVRDMAVSLGKQIELKMEGAGTELDRTIIEAIKDPLVHLVRNSCDHGIEAPEKRVAAGKSARGTMSLRAYHEGGQVNIELSDDGAGVNIARVKEKAIEKGILRPDQTDKLSERDAVNLIFHPGFSTAQKISNISGRGVGMDVVKSRIEAIGGVVDVTSQFGHGMTVKIRIPLTLAIIPGLVISSGGERFVIPQVSLLELIRLEGDQIRKQVEYVHGVPVYRRRGTLLPIAYLNEVLGLKSTQAEDVVNMIVLQAEDRQFGLVVDGINDTQEIVVKALGKQLKSLPLYAGATIMGDGQVALILDVMGVGQRSGVLTQLHEKKRIVQDDAATAKADERQTLLLFRAGSFERLAVPLDLVARLEEFPVSAVEHASGRDVLQYRGSILPLISLREFLEPGVGEPASTSALQVLVFNHGSISIGVVVDKILDIADDFVTARQVSTRKGILGSAVVGKRITDFLDLNAVLKAVTSHGPKGRSAETAMVLVADPDPFLRSVVRTCLEMEEYTVLEASSVDYARKVLESSPAALVIAGPDMCEKARFLEQAPVKRQGVKIPVMALTNGEELQARYVGADRCVSRYDSQAILSAVAHLLSEGPSAQDSEMILEAV